MNSTRWLFLVILALAGAALDVWTKDLAFRRLDVPAFKTIDEFESRRQLMAQAAVEKERRRIRREQHRRISRAEENATARAVNREVLVDGWFDLSASLNPGAFSGLMGDYPLALTLLTCLLPSLLFLYLLRWTMPTNTAVAGVGLVVAGAVGNLWDRFTVGGVRDFFHLHYHYEVNWNVFNVADVWIVIGAALVMVHEIFLKKPGTEHALQPASPGTTTPASGGVARRSETRTRDEPTTGASPTGAGARPRASDADEAAAPEGDGSARVEPETGGEPAVEADAGDD